MKPLWFSIPLKRSVARRARLVRWLPLVGLCVGMVASIEITRACYSGMSESVHFHSGMPDFGLPPRRAIRMGNEGDDRPARTKESEALPVPDRGDAELTPDNDEAEKERKEKEREQALKVAAREEQRGRWDAARRIYARLAKRNGWTGDLRDRVEVLGRVSAMPRRSQAFVRALQTYLAGMRYDARRKRAEAQKAFEAVHADRQAGFLREHALYQLGSLAYAWWDYPLAVTLYEWQLREFPHSAKREATLVMLARAALLPGTAEGQRIASGKRALAELRRRYPHSRFARSILGLLGRVHYLENRAAPALWCYLTVGDLDSVERVVKQMPAEKRSTVSVRLLAAYLKRLGTTSTYGDYARAVRHIDALRAALTPAQARRFAQWLRGDSGLLAAYLYFRLNHTRNRPADLNSLARMAEEMAKRNDLPRLSADVRAQIAEIYYRQGHYERAVRWANRALAAHPSARALYVRGASLHKRNRLRAAVADFERIVRRFPQSALQRGAREELAILHENLGELGAALDQYFALEYEQDIAYLLDIRMTLPEVRAYVERRPDHPKHALLAYSLGIRCLREERWDEADRWLRRLPRSLYAAYSVGRKEWEWNDPVPPEPLVTVRDLRRLHQAVGSAKTDRARAEALFRYGSYYSTHGTLLLYNAALWHQSRELSFEMWWNARQATKQDMMAVRRHMYQHEGYARAREICLAVVRRYPKSSVTPQALYRAANCARHLARFNAWWNGENKKHDYWKECSRLMRRLARDYPTHPLAVHARKYARVFEEESHMEWPIGRTVLH